jgi:hypothetical protein
MATDRPMSPEIQASLVRPAASEVLLDKAGKLRRTGESIRADSQKALVRGACPPSSAEHPDRIARRIVPAPAGCPGHG